MQRVVQRRSLSVTTVAVYLAVSPDVMVFLPVQMAVMNKDAVGGRVLTYTYVTLLALAARA